jgi:hypothetical protein
MPVLIVHGLPTNTPEVDLKVLIDALQRVTSKAFYDVAPGQVSVFFPKDICDAGLGEEIIVFVQGLYEKPERSDDILLKLAISIAQEVKVRFPDADVECFITTQNPKHCHVMRKGGPK